MTAMHVIALNGDNPAERTFEARSGKLFESRSDASPLGEETPESNGLCAILILASPLIPKRALVIGAFVIAYWRGVRCGHSISAVQIIVILNNSRIAS